MHPLVSSAFFLGDHYLVRHWVRKRFFFLVRWVKGARNKRKSYLTRCKHQFRPEKLYFPIMFSQKCFFPIVWVTLFKESISVRGGTHMWLLSTRVAHVVSPYVRALVVFRSFAIPSRRQFGLLLESFSESSLCECKRLNYYMLIPRFVRASLQSTRALLTQHGGAHEQLKEGPDQHGSPSIKRFADVVCFSRPLAWSCNLKHHTFFEVAPRVSDSQALPSLHAHRSFAHSRDRAEWLPACMVSHARLCSRVCLAQSWHVILSQFLFTALHRRVSPNVTRFRSEVKPALKMLLFWLSWFCLIGTLFLIISVAARVDLISSQMPGVRHVTRGEHGGVNKPVVSCFCAHTIRCDLSVKPLGTMQAICRDVAVAPFFCRFVSEFLIVGSRHFTYSNTRLLGNERRTYFHGRAAILALSAASVCSIFAGRWCVRHLSAGYFYVDRDQQAQRTYRRE